MDVEFFSGVVQVKVASGHIIGSTYGKNGFQKKLPTCGGKGWSKKER